MNNAASEIHTPPT